MKSKKIFYFITLLFVIVITAVNPVTSYASESTPPYYDIDTDELRQINLEGELKLDYFEPNKVNLKTETILCAPTSTPQNLQFLFTYAYEYDTLGNTILFDSKEFEKGASIKSGKTYLYAYDSNNNISSYALTDIGLRWGNPTTTNASYQFSYDGNNRLKTLSYHYPAYTGNGTYSYNEQNQLQSIAYNANGNKFRKEYYYDTLGNCIEYRGYTNNQLMFQNFYTYDEQNKLVAFRNINYLENNVVMSDNSYQFSFDTYGNITSAVVVKNYMNKRTDTSTILCQNQYDSLNRIIARTVVYSGSGLTYSYIYEYHN